MKQKTRCATWLLGSAALWAGCTNTGNREAAVTDTSTVQEVVVDGHYAAIALDYHGTYVGQLPCAECEEEVADAEVVVNADSTFRYTRFPAGEGAEPTVVTGSWSIDRNTLTLSEAEVSFHVAENRLIPLGEDGQRFTGELEERFSLHKL